MVGAGGFGRMVGEQAMLQYDCAFVDDGQAVGTEICGIPAIGNLAHLTGAAERITADQWSGLATTSSEHRCMRRRKPLAMGSPTSLLPVPISVRIPSWDAVVWYCKMPVSRTVRPLATVFC